MDLGIEGKVALVQGASKGIGLGIARSLAREGARVVISSRSAENLDEALGKIAGEAHPLPADTGDLERMEKLPAEVEAEFGPLEIVVTNTGGPPPGSALQHGREEWETAYRNLVLSPRTLVEAAIAGMRERKWGRIVNVASSSVREPIPGLALSNAHRMATVGLFKTLADEVSADGVTLNTIATGRFATERQADRFGSLDRAIAQAREHVPAGRLGDPDEFGDLVAFICSERASYLTGTVIPLDGGMLHSS